jgi:predicted metal-binding protein
MEKLAIIRCEKNLDRCPMTECLESVRRRMDGFAGYEDPRLLGIFTCHCNDEIILNLCRILKEKGVEIIHFCTCTFAREGQEQWIEGEGLCHHVDELMERIHKELGLRCVKGTAHLPKDYEPKAEGM